ncbi:MAG: flavodoxin domain-containing protein [Haloarculaceae archaeon]
MARVLLLYGTSEGQTATIAERIGEVLSAAGHEPALVHAKHRPPGFALSDYDAVIVAASVHVGKHQKYVTRFVREHADELASMPSAFVSVSLSAAGDEESQAEAAALIDEFVERTGWKPDHTLSAAGALRFSEYGLLTKFVMKQIAHSQSGDTDTARDYEYTDWESVESFAGEFVSELA